MHRTGILVILAVTFLQNLGTGFGVDRPPSEYNTETDSFSRLGRVIGGRPAIPGEFPYQLQLRFIGPKTDEYEGNEPLQDNMMISPLSPPITTTLDENLFCGATLVLSPSSGTQIAITAAHCVTWSDKMPFDPDMLELRAGTVDADGIGQSLFLQDIVVHSKFKETIKGSPVNDIAVLILDGQFTLNDNVQPLDLPKKSQTTTDKVTLSGWGRTSARLSEGADTLQAVDLPIVESDTCNSYYAKRQRYQLIFSTNFCAGTEKGEKFGCNGDSGGPAASLDNGKLYLAGVVSWGHNECAKFPTVFTRVSSYVDWIREVAP